MDLPVVRLCEHVERLGQLSPPWFYAAANQSPLPPQGIGIYTSQKGGWGRHQRLQDKSKIAQHACIHDSSALNDAPDQFPFPKLGHLIPV